MPVIFPNSLDELLETRLKKPVVAVLKRGSSTPVPFEKQKLIKAIEKAGKASGRNYSPNQAEEIAEQVILGLRSEEIFSHSGRTIPEVEDVQDKVDETYKEINARAIAETITKETELDYSQVYPIALKLTKSEKIDSTGEFYKRYRGGRAEVRQRLVEMPPIVEGSDSTDKQLHIHKINNGEAHNFNANSLLDLILERTPANYDDAMHAVKRVEGFLAHRGSREPVSQEEVVAIADASLMERGISPFDVLGGRRLPITLDDVIQMIVNKSAENSNIKSNNPEAVNLGIAELALKEFALREVFDEDVTAAHSSGMVHLHDLGYIIRTYCSAHSIEFIKMGGLDDSISANLDAKSSPAKDPRVLNNHVHTFLSFIQPNYAGALGFPLLNTLYGPAVIRDIEIVEGKELKRDTNGKVIEKIPKRLRRETLEGRVQDGDLKREDFEETKTTRVLRRYSQKEQIQIAQNLIFGVSQAAYSRGGQTLFTDFNIDLTTPAHVREVPALFLGAQYIRAKKNEFGEWEVVERTNKAPERHKGLIIDKGHKDKKGKIILEPDNKNGDVIQPNDGTVWLTYGSELIESALQDFAEAICEVSKSGDKYGNTFNFPKIDVHVGRDTFRNQRANELLMKFCQLTEKNDATYFMFDRGDGMNVSQCCRLRERITDPEILKHPEKMRFCGFQNVSINLAQAAFRSTGDNLESKVASTLEEIDKAMLIALKAHTNKRRKIQQLFDTPGSPLYNVGGVPTKDGQTYIDLAKSSYIIGVVALNEAVQHITGKQLHEDPDSYLLGLRILSHMYSIKNMFTERYGMKFVIEETPGESANRRLAKIDLKKFPAQAKAVIKGDFERDEVYYTNSSHLTADAPVSGLDRMILQSKMNPLIEAGAITHIFSGEKQNKAEAVYDFVKSTFLNTQSSQIVFSGEHTVCNSCGNHTRGLHESCSNCGNNNASKISQKTRIVGYFSDPRTWHKSKKGERKSREVAQEFYAGEKPSVFDLEAELLKRIIEPGKVRFAVIGKKDCPVCEIAMQRVTRFREKYIPEELRASVEIVKYDVSDKEGRVMAAIYDSPIDTYPTIVMHSGDRFERKGWEYPYNEKVIDVNTGDLTKMFSNLGYQPRKS